MGSLLKFAWKDLLRSSRDPLVFLIWIGIPLGIGLLLNLAFAGGGGSVPRVHLHLVDEGDSLIGRLLESSGSGTGAEFLDIERVSLGEGRERIDAGEGSALLILPDGLTEAVLKGERAELVLLTNPAQRILPRIAEELLSAVVDLVFYAQRVFGDRMEEFAAGPLDGANAFPDETIASFSIEVNRFMASLEQTFFPPLLELESESAEALDTQGESGESAEKARAPSFMALMFPGFLIMALCFMAEGLSADIWRERDSGTLARAVSTPRGAAPLVLGKVCAGGFLMLAVSVAAGGLGAWVYGLDVSAVLLFGIFSPLAGMAFLTGFLALHVHTSSQKAGSLLGSALLFPLLMAGGSFFPLETMPGWLAAIGRRTPNGWVLQQLKRVAFTDHSITELIMPSAAILVAMVVLAWLALRRLPRFLGS